MRLGFQGLELVLLGYGCCYCYRSSKVCPADVTPCPVQVKGPKEMANPTGTARKLMSTTQAQTCVRGQAYENRR